MRMSYGKGDIKKGFFSLSHSRKSISVFLSFPPRNKRLPYLYTETISDMPPFHAIKRVREEGYSTTDSEYLSRQFFFLQNFSHCALPPPLFLANLAAESGRELKGSLMAQSWKDCDLHFQSKRGKEPFTVSPSFYFYSTSSTDRKSRLHGSKERDKCAPISDACSYMQQPNGIY